MDDDLEKIRQEVWSRWRRRGDSETPPKGTPDEQRELDALAWVTWGRVKAASGISEDKFSERDREMFFLGFAAGRLDAIKGE